MLPSSRVDHFFLFSRGSMAVLAGALLVVLGSLLATASAATTAPAATVAAGERQSCAVMSGVLRCWGQDSSGALGFLTDEDEVPYATPVAGALKGVTHVISTGTGNGGSGHACAISSGAAWCWGPNGYGVAGNGNKERMLETPLAISALAGGVTLIDKNASRSCGIVNGGALCWGSGYLGNGSGKESSVPVAVTGMASGVTDIGVGWRSICVLQSGKVFCWGYGSHGQLGGGGSTKEPTGAVALPGPATAVDAGSDSACAVVNGGVWCWGWNSSGALGVGSGTKESDTAVNVSGLPAGSGVVDISGNTRHYCALLGNGSVRCWGDNSSGESGNGTATGIAATPVAVRLPGPATSVAVGGHHACAAVGTNVYCWGANNGGQLGGGTVGGASGVPVKVLLPPKATVAGVARSVEVTGSRKATVGTVMCPKGAGPCALVLSNAVTVKLGGIPYKVAIAKLAPVKPGTTGEIVATLPATLVAKLTDGKSVGIPVKVAVTNAGGKLVKNVGANVKP
jgi:alpha-tubulin suppressor-like RCC1 family protein